MNWNSIVQSVVAFVSYTAIVLAFLANLSALEFALFSAVAMSLALWVQSIDFTRAENRRTQCSSGIESVLPSLNESMDQLHALQTEINHLQTRFTSDVEARANRNFQQGSAS